jgi:prepilin-type processing-associated H-X9-DG protein
VNSPPPLDYDPAKAYPDAGAFDFGGRTGSADVTDGLSNTIGMAERLQGDWQAGSFRRGGDYYLDTSSSFPKPPNTLDQIALHCRSITLDPSHIIESRGGESWLLGGRHFTWYDHALPPNAGTDCALDANDASILNRFQKNGAFGASSQHSGGVNALRMDGSVQFIHNAIELRVWRALGTRAGGETFSDGEL